MFHSSVTNFGRSLWINFTTYEKFLPFYKLRDQSRKLSLLTSCIIYTACTHYYDVDYDKLRINTIMLLYLFVMKDTKDDLHFNLFFYLFRNIWGHE